MRTGTDASPGDGPVVALLLATFPPDADVSLIPAGMDASSAARVLVGRRVAPEDTGPRRLQGVRLFHGVPPDARLLIHAPGYQPRVLYLGGNASEARSPSSAVEVRLLPVDGPLTLVAEVPTGASPKSAAFLPDDRIVVPLLRDAGIDLFRLHTDRWGQVHVEPAGRIAPPEDQAAAHGFVESLVIPERRELWVSQMHTDLLHRFDLSTLAYRGSVPSLGRWPKVMTLVRLDAADRGSGTPRSWLVGSNWVGANVVFHALEDEVLPRRRIVRDVFVEPAPDTPLVIPVDAEPRGMVFVTDPPEVWVGSFSTGDIAIIDPMRGTVTERLRLGPGAARHLVASADQERIYYSDMFHGTVSIIDRATRRVVRRRYVGSNVNTICLDRHDRLLFVSERGRNNGESYLLPGPTPGRIVVLDADSLEVVQEVWARSQPTGLAVSPDGRFLAATDFLDDNLAVYRITSPPE